MTYKNKLLIEFNTPRGMIVIDKKGVKIKNNFSVVLNKRNVFSYLS